MGKIPNLRFCNGQNLGDIFICPEFPVVRDAPLDINAAVKDHLEPPLLKSSPLFTS